jgi:RimJ/RimL family protein N-acetyltransferase
LFWKKVAMIEKTAIPGLPDTINTDRLLLRAPVLADAPALTALANNWEIHKFLARLPYPYTNENAVEFITKMARTKDEHAYAITLKGGEFIGIMGIHLTSEIGPELGYWLGQPFWGKGYATEAARGVLDAAVGGGFSTILARSITQNKGSIAVLGKVGFLQTAEGIGDCCQHKNVCVTHFVWERGK